jgi:DNA-3-methyladenine glycosylase II
MTPESLSRTSVASAATSLAKRDPDLALILDRHGPPPLWARRPGFATLIQIILEQQVSLSSAASMYKRLRNNVVPFRPYRFIELGEPHLKSLGVTRQKTSYCLHLAECVTVTGLRLPALARMSDDDVKTALTQIKGIGPWSADIYLLMALRRPDIWPVSDLALATAVTKVKKLKKRPTTDQLLRMAESWRPYRSVAARMLWQFYLAERR